MQENIEYKPQGNDREFLKLEKCFNSIKYHRDQMVERTLELGKLLHSVSVHKTTIEFDSLVERIGISRERAFEYIKLHLNLVSAGK